MKNFKYLYILASLLIFNLANTFANSDCNPPTASIQLDVNNVRALLMNGGDKFWDIFKTQSAGYEIPKGSGKNAIFASAIWISGVDAGNNLYTAAQTYRQRGLDFWPGSLDAMGEVKNIDCKESDKMYPVYGEEIVNAKIGKGIAYNVSRWPSAVADFYDANNDGIYDPSLGDYPMYDKNKPNLIPSQMIFWVINDKGNTHGAFVNTNRLGIEIQMTAFAFTSTDDINNTTFYRYKIINKSSNTYTQFRFSEFADFDLGNPADDYVGCDLSNSLTVPSKKRNLFYTYNGDNNDEDGGAPGYGAAPPAAGVCFLNSGLDSAANPLPMNSFIFFTNASVPGVNGDPIDYIQLDRYIRGFWADGQPLTYGTPDGRGGVDPYKFAFPGDTDPSGKPNWVETNAPGDRRSVASISPKKMEPGQQMTIELAYVWAKDSSAQSDNYTSVAKLKSATDVVIQAYQNDFASYTTNINTKKKEYFSVYPNPAKDVLNIQADFKISEIIIYDLNGRIIKRITKTNTRKIDIDDLPNGTYIIKINDAVQRFVKL